MKFHLILSLDYEVFGDGSGCLQNCLLNPTNECLRIVNQHAGKLTFFADALELYSFSQQQNSPTQQHYALVAQQLASLMNSPHNLQLHLHPQWQNASFDQQEWQLDFSKWRIGDLEKVDIDSCINSGLDFLQQFGPRTGQDLVAFRAGGWAIQPSGPVIDALSASNIIIDSTVAPGLHNPALGDWYDFRSAPALPFWAAGQDICRPLQQGTITEVPITTAYLGRHAHWQALRERRSHPALPEGCTGSYANSNTRWQNIKYKLNKLWSLGLVMLDFSSLPSWALIEITRKHMEQYKDFPGPIPIVAIGHNKNFTAWSAQQLNAYLEWAQNQQDLVFSDYGQWYNMQSDGEHAFETSPVV